MVVVDFRGVVAPASLKQRMRENLKHITRIHISGGVVAPASLKLHLSKILPDLFSRFPGALLPRPH